MSADDVTIEVDQPVEIAAVGFHFGMIPDWVLTHPDLSAEAVRLFGVLACYWANRSSQECWPSYATVAKRIGVNRRSVIRWVGDLRAAGAIETTKRLREDGSHTSNVITLCMAPRGVVTGESPPPTQTVDEPVDNAGGRTGESLGVVTGESPLELELPELEKSVAPDARAATPTVTLVPPAAATDRIEEATEIVAGRRNVDRVAPTKPNPRAWAIAARQGIRREVEVVAGQHPDLDAGRLAESISGTVTRLDVGRPGDGVVAVPGGMFSPGSGIMAEVNYSPPEGWVADPAERHRIAQAAKAATRQALAASRSRHPAGSDEPPTVAPQPEPIDVVESI